MQYFAVLIGLLQDRKQFLEEIGQGIKIERKITALLITSSIFFAIYGGIIGAFSSPLQLLASAVKLPALYLITLIICLPTLYFFNVIFGSRQTIGQHFALLLTATSIISVLLFSFAPIVLFFLLTTNHYQFFKLLNVAIFAITGFIGVSFLTQGMQLLSEYDASGTEVRARLLKFWLVLYAFVGSQLGWTLRPFFGSPGYPFELFRPLQGNFYLDITQALAEVFGFR
jgi:hypothetical protein